MDTAAVLFGRAAHTQAQTAEAQAQAQAEAEAEGFGETYTRAKAQALAQGQAQHSPVRERGREELTAGDAALPRNFRENQSRPYHAEIPQQRGSSGSRARKQLSNPLKSANSTGRRELIWTGSSSSSSGGGARAKAGRTRYPALVPAVMAAIVAAGLAAKGRRSGVGRVAQVLAGLVHTPPQAQLAEAQVARVRPSVPSAIGRPLSRPPSPARASSRTCPLAPRLAPNFAPPRARPRRERGERRPARDARKEGKAAQGEAGGDGAERGKRVEGNWRREGRRKQAGDRRYRWV
ncbi:hypothetical protein CLOM_g17086 [Closterium sp. NIES-68]|nr:hypothetical protein CLOM_g17086 [Closterium sp. NIES-68]